MNDNLLHKNTLVCVHLPGNHSGHSVQVYKKLKKKMHPKSSKVPHRLEGQ